MLEKFNLTTWGVEGYQSDLGREVVVLAGCLLCLVERIEKDKVIINRNRLQGDPIA